MIFKFTFEIDTDTAPNELYEAVRQALENIYLSDRVFYEKVEVDNLRWQMVYAGREA